MEEGCVVFNNLATDNFKFLKNIMKKLSGKIYWIQDDFNFNGNYFPAKGKTAHIVSKIENVVIDDNIIKFITAPVDFNGAIFSYHVNLLADDNGLGFSGKFTEEADIDWTGEIKCELFENKKAFFVYGKWEEDGVIYTWWARIQKSATHQQTFG
ncbi:MAG: hypothetical protein KBG24_08300 [Bacteroidia bacterium]|nr:hypothetical protein [Bacteroidia bacterium]